MINKLRYLIRKGFSRGMENNDIDINTLNKKYKQGAILIDVRSPQEYKEGHLKGAILIPEYEIKNRIEKELENKEKEIIVYCSSGTRSKNAQKILIQLGYKKVFNLYQGIE